VTTAASTSHGWDAALTLRPIRSDDHAFLLGLYATTRAQELAALPWDDEQKALFVRMQFEAQHAQYQEHYAGATFDLILIGDEPAGRLYVMRAGEEIRIVDIALLPEYCNRGIGTMLLERLQSEAAAAARPLRIHVERFNPAMRLYQRLGFVPIADRGVYLFMEWRPGKGAEKQP
jgi:GNAT superfamily N-acetyltransferase